MGSDDEEGRAAKRPRVSSGTDEESGDKRTDGQDGKETDGKEEEDADDYESAEAWAGGDSALAPLLLRCSFVGDPSQSCTPDQSILQNTPHVGIWSDPPHPLFAAWEQEMKQYPGWEKGEGAHGVGGEDVVETSGDEGAGQVANHC